MEAVAVGGRPLVELVEMGIMVVVELMGLLITRSGTVGLLW